MIFFYTYYLPIIDIGRIGGWGANGPNTFPPHLHLEFYKGRAVYGGNHFDPMSIIGK